MTFGPYAIMASGTGTNAMALIKMGKACEVVPSFILATNEGSSLREVTKEEGIPFYHEKSRIKGVDISLEEKILDLVDHYQVKWLFLAGFLKILSPSFLKVFNEGHSQSQVINIHPSLLPLYPGLGGYKKAFTNKDEKFGHSIHHVTDELDAGPLISQVSLNRIEGESFEEMVQRAKQSENENYAHILKSFIRGNL